MEFIVNTEQSIPKDNAEKLKKQFMDIKGVTKVEVLTNSITVTMPIVTTNEKTWEVAVDMADIEHYYSK